MDKQNRAGYSPLMLTALATLKTQEDIETVMQLFRLGDVNAKASQVGAGPWASSCLKVKVRKVALNRSS